jgi:hypothetical protein
VLRRTAIVQFVVRQMAPACRTAGRFRVLGRRGVNRLRFRGRIGRHRLPPGTYQIEARTLSGRRTLTRRRFVIVGHPSRDEIARAQRANACVAAAGGHRNSVNLGAARAGSRGRTALRPPVRTGPTATPPDHGILGTRFTRHAVDAIGKIPLWLYAELLIALGLLGVAALPWEVAPSRRLASALARRRGLFAIAGGAMLAAASVTYGLALAVSVG